MRPATYLAIRFFMDVDQYPCVVALDVGGQGCRIAVFDMKGTALFRSQASYSTQYNGPRVEQNPQEILSAIKACETELLAFLESSFLTSSFLDGSSSNTSAADAYPLNLIGAGVACQGSNLLAWRRDSFEPLTQVLSWQDTRGLDYVQQLTLHDHLIRNITGLWPNAHYGASKYRWCLDNLASVKNALAQQQLTFGPLASFLLAHLARDQARDYTNSYRDHPITEPSHAQRTLLWDIRSGQWNQQLLRAFNIPEALLPIVLTHDCFVAGPDNQLTAGAWHTLKCPIRISMRDQTASLYSEGLPDPNTIYINMGTGIFLQKVIARDLVDNILAQNDSRKLQISTLFYTVNQQHFVVEGSVHSGIACKTLLESITGQALTHAVVEQALSTLNELPDNFTLITSGGVGSPYWLADITNHLPDSINTNHVVGHWLENALFLTLINIELMQQQTRKANHMVISGGMSEYDYLCEYLADLTQLPLTRLDDSQATLRGTAFIAAGMPSEWHQQVGSHFTPHQLSYSSKTSGHIHQRFYRWRQQLHHHLHRYHCQSRQQSISTVMLKTPIWVSHRGDVEQHTENTICGITSAATQGIMDIEFDLQFDQDMTPILSHDPDLSRIFHKSRSVFNYSHQQNTLITNEPQTETLWELLQAIAVDTHLFIEVKHDSIDHWGNDAVLNALQPLLQYPHVYTLLARSQSFLADARQAGHLSIGANVREYTDTERNNIITLAPDFLVINRDRIPTGATLWSGNWRWMVYEVDSTMLATTLLERGATHMISFKACQFHHQEMSKGDFSNAPI